MLKKVSEGRHPTPQKNNGELQCFSKQRKSAEVKPKNLFLIVLDSIHVICNRVSLTCLIFLFTWEESYNNDGSEKLLFFLLEKKM